MILFSAKKNRWKEQFVEKLNPRYIYTCIREIITNTKNDDTCIAV